MQLTETILTQLQTYQHCQRWVIALSGGIDSTVLLHAVMAANKQLQQPKQIVALHINHQLSQYADHWQQHCSDVASTYNVLLSTHKVELKLIGKGIEAAARDARYQVFEQYLECNDVLLLGHHQGDQAETALLRLARGAGVRGLSAMPNSRPLAKGILARPLLNVPKSEIEAYAHSHQLTWVDDDSNTDQYYDRNFVRHSVMPLLEQRWPALPSQLVTMTQHMRQAEQLITELAVQDLAIAEQKTERYGESIALKKLEAFSLARIDNLLRHWCDVLSYPTPEVSHLAQVHEQFLSRSALLSSACVSWSGVQLRQFAGRLYLMQELAPFNHQQHLLWNPKQALPLSDGADNSQLFATLEQAPGLLAAYQNYTVRWRVGGERCTPHTRGHSQTVKKLLQEYGLETWLRDRVPLIYRGDELVAVADLWINQGYVTNTGETGLSIVWQC